MAIFESRTCVAFGWDAVGAVRAVRLRRENDGRLRVLAAVLAADGGFGENLAAARQAVQPAENELVLAGGNLAGAILFEHDFPRLGQGDLTQAIAYELPRQAPIAAEELICSWRQVPGSPEGRMRLRILAIQLRDWNQLLADLADAGIRADAVVSPWMTVDPLLAEAEAVLLPGLDEDFALRRQAEADGQRTMVLGGPPPPSVDETAAAIGLEVTSLPGVFRGDDGGHWLAPALIAAYGVGPCWRRDRPGLLPLPGELHPVRFQAQRTLFAIVLALAAVLALAFVVRLALDARRTHRALVRERQETLRQVQEFDVRNRAMEPVDAVIREFAEASPGVADMLFCLHHFTTRIPKSMSLTQLNSRGTSFDLNLRTTSDQDDKLAALESGGAFQTRHLQKRRNTDGSVNIFLKLTYRPPGQEVADVAAD
jgi:Tfp pilus assembly protein PilN